MTVSTGSALQVYVNAALPYRAALIRLDDPSGENARIVELGEYPCQEQATYPGSYVRVPHSPLLGCETGITIDVRFFSTTPSLPREQGIIAKWRHHPARGWGLLLADRRIVLRLADGLGNVAELTADSLEVLPSTWYRVVAGFASETQVGFLAVTPTTAFGAGRGVVVVEEALSLAGIAGNEAPVLIAAYEEVHDAGGRSHATGLYNGKIENPAVFARGHPDPRAAIALPLASGIADHAVARWDFSRSPEGAEVIDAGSACLHGCAVNAPMRGVTGSTWRGLAHQFALAPDEYAAMHFHDDDLDDARWERSFSFDVPSGCPSGAYAVQLVSERAEDRIPFFIVPDIDIDVDGAGPSIAFLAPTLTYVAYGNEHLWQRQVTVGLDSPDWRLARAEHPSPVDLYVAAHRELGRSIYDLHSDGTGVCYASRRRPILNLRDDYRLWLSNAPRHFAADLLFLRWMGQRRHPYVVLTDEVLHDGGVEAISPYKVVITGSHPEYFTSEMLDAVQRYLDGGGRLMYLGGNGFYWVTSLDKARPYLIEVRRGNAGTRNWTSAPGEAHHSTTGELGGLWRHRGRPPQQLVGVGFTGLGYRQAAGYARTPASHEPEVSFVFDGVDSEVVGEFGLALGGAAGDEIDRHDPALGSRPESVVLATSQLRHDASYQLCVEDVQQTAPLRDGEHDPLVRADMVYTPLPDGAAVFSVGSINWIASLADNRGENDVARITENVLRRFLA